MLRLIRIIDTVKTDLSNEPKFGALECPDIVVN